MIPTTLTEPSLNGAKPKTKKAAEKPNLEVINQIAMTINMRGWVAHDEIVIDDESYAAIRALKRKGLITPKPGLNGEPGWELVGQQRIPQMNDDATPTNKPYSQWSPFFRLTMEFLSLSYAQQGEGTGPFLFPRTIDNQIFFAPKNFRAMLKKAWKVTQIKSSTGKPISSDAIQRIRVKVALLPASTPTTHNNIRRPVNTKGEAVGELRGEALPPGTRLSWDVSFPLSHFTQDTINELLDICQEIGFSCAGNGKGGGGAGLFQWTQGE